MKEAMKDTRVKLLEKIGGRDYQPVTIRVLARQLGVSGEQYKEFKSLVKRLIAEGQIGVGRNKTLRRSAVRDSLVVGTFRRTSRGFGFVRPSSSVNKDNDIYIPIQSGLDASNGDEVAVRVLKKPNEVGAKLQGTIVEVRTRAVGLFVGTYSESDRTGFVKIDGTTFRDPIEVGDPGAKGGKPGDKVTVEIVRYPTPYLIGQGVVTEVLGPRGQPGVDTLSIIRAYNLPDRFDESVLAEAREQASRFDPENLEGRTDLTPLLTVTIDPQNARDFDDAITLSRDDRGFWNLGVHIADVAWFVPLGGSLDQSARHRGTSVYLPDRVLPMLPEAISNSLASLQAQQTRYTLSVLLELDPSGIVTDRKFVRSAIRVDQRFTYEQAHAVMTSSPERGSLVSIDLARLLDQMLELAMILRKRRISRGALELSMPEISVELGDEGQVVGAHLVEHDESHRVIEEFMLAANEAVASFLSERGVGFLRRVHPDPEPNKLMQFADFARSLGVKIDQPQSRFELQRVLQETANLPEAHAIHYGLLRSLKQATYTPESEGHYALASQDYCHFTSPIRRYPDLQVHRQLVTILEGGKPRSNLDELATLGEHCTRTERKAEAAERDLVKIKLLTYLDQKIGTCFHAVIVGVEDFGLFCRLVELPAEGLLHVTELDEAEQRDEFFVLEPETHSLVGRNRGKRYRLGDRIEVKVARVDVDRRELDLILAHRDLDAGSLPRIPTPARAKGLGRNSAGPAGARKSSDRKRKIGTNPKKGKKRKK